MKHLTQAEISTILWCMEQMASDFQEGDESTNDFLSAFAKIESASDLCDKDSVISIFVD
jgi:hypothetical protein